MSVSIQKTRSRRANGHTRKCCRNNLRPRLTAKWAGLRSGSPSENGKAKLIPFLGAAHEGGKFGVEARGSLEERRVADALVDRKLGAGDHLRRVFGGVAANNHRGRHYLTTRPCLDHRAVGSHGRPGAILAFLSVGAG